MTCISLYLGLNITGIVFFFFLIYYSTYLIFNVKGETVHGEAVDTGGHVFGCVFDCWRGAHFGYFFAQSLEGACIRLCDQEVHDALLRGLYGLGGQTFHTFMRRRKVGQLVQQRGAEQNIRFHEVDGDGVLKEEHDVLSKPGKQLVQGS